MKVTAEQLFTFRQAAAAYVAEKRKEGFSKFVYALEKMLIKTKNHARNLENQIANLEITHAATDEKGILIIQNGNLVYTKDGKIALNKAVEELMKQEVEIEEAPYFLSEEDYPQFSPLEEEVFGKFIAKKTN
jgi:hypothetical protein